MAGVSHDTVRKVEQIIAKATSEVVAKVRSGELSINAAAKMVAPPKPTKAVALVENPSNVDAGKRVKIKLDSTALAENEVPHDQVQASQAQTEPLTDATSTFSADEELLSPSAPDQVISSVAELGQLRGQVAALQARLDEVMEENKMMEGVFAANDKVQASMEEAKKQKSKANEDSRALFIEKNKALTLAAEVKYWKDHAEKEPPAQVEPASDELVALRKENAALRKELDGLKAAGGQHDVP